MRLQTFLAGALVLGIATAAAAQDASEAPPPWTGSLGLSFVSTTGNSDTRSLGFDFALKRDPAPWGWDLAASFMRADQNGETTAERYTARGRGERALSERWSLFAGASGEKDTFAGYDLRTILEAGASYAVLATPRHDLSVDGGLTWTREDLVDGPSNDFMGGVVGLSYAWKIQEGSSLTERLVLYPDFDRTSNWRATSETALQSSLSEVLALKVAYSVRYDNEPVVGFDDTDTTSTVSLVVSF